MSAAKARGEASSQHGEPEPFVPEGCVWRDDEQAREDKHRLEQLPCKSRTLETSNGPTALALAQAFRIEP